MAQLGAFANAPTSLADISDTTKPLSAVETPGYSVLRSRVASPLVGDEMIRVASLLVGNAMIHKAPPTSDGATSTRKWSLLWPARFFKGTRKDSRTSVNTRYTGATRVRQWETCNSLSRFLEDHRSGFLRASPVRGGLKATNANGRSRPACCRAWRVPRQRRRC